MKTRSFFRIKTEWTKEMENGGLGKVKTEELVMAANYSDAETTAYAIAEDQHRGRYGSFNIEIVKTNIDMIHINDVMMKDDVQINGNTCLYFQEGDETGTGLYAVKVILFTKEEGNEKTKKCAQVVYVPAVSNAMATKEVEDMMEGNATVEDYVIRDAKFDKAEAIYLPDEQYQRWLNI